LARDAAKLALIDSGDPLAVAKRAVQAIQASTTIAADSFRKEGSQSQSQSQAQDNPNAEYFYLLRRFFEEMGAGYVKLGQFIASSPTLFPRELTEEMQKCLDQVPPLDYRSEIYPVLLRELGGEDRLREIFTYIDEQPLATASIAQVHRAVLRQPASTQVVIKVVKPEVDKALRTDLDGIYIACRALELMDKSLESRWSLSKVMEDAREAIMAETNLVKERQAMDAFRAFLNRETFDGEGRVVVPETFDAVSTEKVLVMEELQGITLSKFLTEEEQKKDARDKIAGSNNKGDAESLVVLALNVWIASVASCESFHGDLHSANLIVMPPHENDLRRRYRLGFIDFGSVGRITKRTKRALFGLASALPARDWGAAARCLVGLGAIAGSDAETFAVVEPLARDLEQLSGDVEDLIDEIEREIVARAVRGDLDLDLATGDVSLTEVAMQMRMDMNVSDAPESAAASVASLDVAEKANRLVLDVVETAEKRGLRFPREFALIVKQMLYFDRFVKVLAPDINVLEDDRINL